LTEHEVRGGGDFPFRGSKKKKQFEKKTARWGGQNRKMRLKTARTTTKCARTTFEWKVGGKNTMGEKSMMAGWAVGRPLTWIGLRT